MYRDPPIHDGETTRLYHPNLLTQVAESLGSIEPKVALFLIVSFVFTNLASGYFGWYARGLWGPIYDNRGWAALVVFSIVGSVYMINSRD